MSKSLRVHLPLLLVAVACASAVAADFPPRNLLAGPRSPQWVRENLVAPGEFQPYPTAADRLAWEKLPAAVRTGLIKKGEAYLDHAWQSLPASVFLEYARNGNRENYQRIVFRRRQILRELTLAECVESKGRFLDQIVNGLWLTCEETCWAIPAHIGGQKAGKGLPDADEPTIDLFAGETSAQLAWTLYLLGPQLDKVSPLVRRRIEREIDQRILTPFVQRDDFWWMGLGSRKDMNNWTPWIISNILPSALIIDRDPDRRAAIVHKSLRITDAFLNVYPDDGSCDEGPSYWGRAGGSLFDCLDFLHQATRGKIDLFKDPLVINIARYIGSMHVAGPWYVNFGDASARTRPDGALIYRFGRSINDPQTMQFGAWILNEDRKSRDYVPGGTLDRVLPELFSVGDAKLDDAQPLLLRDVWMPDLQMMTARDQAGSDQGLFVAVMGGHNDQSHNHNDVGSFVVALHGRPMLIDVGVETYTAQTFSNRRYELWTMQSAFHNLPTINGQLQSAGRKFAARDVTYDANDGASEVSMDLAPAYPTEAQVKSWRRLVRLTRGQQIVINDTFELGEVIAPTVLNLMTASAVDLSGPGVVIVSADKDHAIEITYDPSLLKASVEDRKVEDARLKPVWGGIVRRIQLTSRQPAPKGSFQFTIKASGSTTPR